MAAGSIEGGASGAARTGDPGCAAGGRCGGLLGFALKLAAVVGFTSEGKRRGERGLGGNGDWCGGGGRNESRGGEVFFNAKVFAHVTERLVGERHFAQVVAPDVGAGAAAHERLAGDGAKGAVGHAALEGLLGDLEGDGSAGFPEGAREFVGKEKRVVAAVGFEVDECRFGTDPGEGEARGVPAAEFESVIAGLADENL